MLWVLASREKESSNPTIIKLLRKQATQSAKSCSEKEPLLKRRSCGRRGALNLLWVNRDQDGGSVPNP